METILLGNANCTENMNWTESVFLAVETMGFLTIDYQNDTWPEEGFDHIESDEDTWVTTGPNDNDIVVSLPEDDHDNILDTTDDDDDVDDEDFDFESRWYHVYFTPSSFNVTILNQTDFYYSNLTDFYYRNMTDLYSNNMTEGTCMPILDYWNNQTHGCACNGTWDSDGYYNTTTKAFMGGRQISPSQCYNDSCREAFFLNDTIKYANMRINITEHDNGTVFKTVEITRMSFNKDEGYTYGVNDVAYVYGVVNQPNMTVTDSAPILNNININATIGDDDDNVNVNFGSNGVALPMSTLITMMVIFLLSMIHPN
jgi:hypothetical protein